MEFDVNAFNQTIGKIRTLATDILHGIYPIMPPALDYFIDRLFWPFPVPGFVRDAAHKILKWCYDAFVAFVDQTFSLLEGALVPVTAFLRGVAWGSERQKLDTLQLDLSAAVADVAITWTGPGASAFGHHADQHVTRLKDMTALAGEMRDQAWKTAAAGLAFYVALATVIVKATATTTVAAASTAVDGPVGPAAAGAAAGLGTVEAIGLVATIGAVITEIATGTAALSDKANAVARDWPSPGSADYSDGSASDGDRTDWSTQR